MFDIQKYISKYDIISFCQQRHIKRLSLFGSAQKGGFNQDSDIDLLVEFEKKHIPGFFEICRMEIELSDIFHKKVDLRTPEELSRYFREEILQTALVQYESKT